MPHKTQEEAQKPGVTPLRLPTEGEPCEWECEAAKIVVMAKGTNRILELPMEVAEIDEIGEFKPGFREWFWSQFWELVFDFVALKTSHRFSH